MRFTKEQFSIYLNRVYLGSGTYGVQAASEKYFNKKVQDLTLYESAVIASLLKALRDITQFQILNYLKGPL